MTALAQRPDLPADPKFLEIVTSGDVETKVAKVNGYLLALNADVGAAAAVDERFTRAWTAFYNSWKAFFDEYKGGCWFGCVAAIERAEDYEREAVIWAEKLRQLGGAVTAPQPQIPLAKGWWMKPALWVAGILGVAYVVSKIVPLVRTRRTVVADFEELR